jgi:hypothetical protein
MPLRSVPIIKSDPELFFDLFDGGYFVTIATQADAVA